MKLKEEKVNKIKIRSFGNNMYLNPSQTNYKVKPG